MSLQLHVATDLLQHIQVRSYLQLSESLAFSSRNDVTQKKEWQSNLLYLIVDLQILHVSVI